MKRAVIFGAGQGGKMLLKLISDEYQVIAFSDNNPNLEGAMVNGLPVISGREIHEYKVDVVFIAILNDEACQKVYHQLIDLGIDDVRIHSIVTLRKQFDIRLATIRLLSEEIYRRKVKGAVAELGVYQGRSAIQINTLFPDRLLYLFDTFQGFDERDTKIEIAQSYSSAQTGKFSDTSIELVWKRLSNKDKAIFYPGYFPETVVDLNETFAFVSIDADLYKPVYEGLRYFYPRMSKGGCILVHDYNSTQFRGVGEAVRKYSLEQNIFVVPLCDLHGSAVIVKV